MTTESVSPGKSARNTRKTAYAVVLVAIGVALAPYTSFPIGIAKVNPTQHFVNVLAAVLLGPWWAVLTAAVIAVLRNEDKRPLFSVEERVGLLREATREFANVSVDSFDGYISPSASIRNCHRPGMWNIRPCASKRPPPYDFTSAL